MCRIVGLASCEDLHRFADVLAHCELGGRSIYIDGKYNIELGYHRPLTIGMSIYRWQLGFYRGVHCEIICEVLKLLQVFYLIKALS